MPKRVDNEQDQKVDPDEVIDSIARVADELAAQVALLQSYVRQVQQAKGA